MSRRDFSRVVMGDGTDGAIIVGRVVVVVMEGHQQNREQHEQRHRQGDKSPVAASRQAKPDCRGRWFHSF
jgi:hypothetical protein